jgi:hypothetical protein
VTIGDGATFPNDSSPGNINAKVNASFPKGRSWRSGCWRSAGRPCSGSGRSGAKRTTGAVNPALAIRWVDMVSPGMPPQYLSFNTPVGAFEGDQ